MGNPHRTLSGASPLRVLLPLAALLLGAAGARAQSEPTASRVMDLQVGASAAFGRSNYLPWDTDGNSAPLSDLTRTVILSGFGAYATLDLRPRFGIEADFRHLTGHDNGGAQTMYQIGGRYVPLRTAHFVPYARGSFGRGVYAYPSSSATLSFNLYGLAAGTDFHLTRALNLRAEYEWQSWLNTPLRNPSPQTITIGIAYHFH